MYHYAFTFTVLNFWTCVLCRAAKTNMSKWRFSEILFFPQKCWWLCYIFKINTCKINIWQRVIYWWGTQLPLLSPSIQHGPTCSRPSPFGSVRSSWHRFHEYSLCFCFVFYFHFCGVWLAEGSALTWTGSKTWRTQSKTPENRRNPVWWNARRRRRGRRKQGCEFGQR